MVCMVVMNRNLIRIEAKLVETNLESVSGIGLYSATVPCYGRCNFPCNRNSTGGGGGLTNRYRLRLSIGIVISNLPFPPEYFFRNSVQSHINPDALAAKTM